MRRKCQAIFVCALLAQGALAATEEQDIVVDTGTAVRLVTERYEALIQEGANPERSAEPSVLGSGGPEVSITDVWSNDGSEVQTTFRQGKRQTLIVSTGSSGTTVMHNGVPLLFPNSDTGGVSLAMGNYPIYSDPSDAYAALLLKVLESSAPSEGALGDTAEIGQVLEMETSDEQRLPTTVAGLTVLLGSDGSVFVVTYTDSLQIEGVFALVLPVLEIDGDGDVAPMMQGMAIRARVCGRLFDICTSPQSSDGAKVTACSAYLEHC